jgi:hypothetical protein
MKKAVELLKIALQFTDDYADVYNLIDGIPFHGQFEIENKISIALRGRRSISFV